MAALGVVPTSRVAMDTSSLLVASGHPLTLQAPAPKLITSNEFKWGQKDNLSILATLPYQNVSLFKGLKTKVVLWLSLVTRQIATRQLVTSSENLVANAQFLFILMTSEVQFQALKSSYELNFPKLN